MKLEHLSNANVNGSGDDLIRLFAFTSTEVKALIRAIRTGIVSEGNVVKLDLLDFIDPLNCTLSLALSESDGGIRMNAPGDFTCEMTEQGFLRMLKLMDPFTKDGTTGHQWLYDLPAARSRIEFLFSRNGKW